VAIKGVFQNISAITPSLVRATLYAVLRDNVSSLGFFGVRLQASSKSKRPDAL